MRKLITNIDVPYQLIEFETQYSQTEKMNILESTIMAAIIYCDELNYKTESLKEVLRLQYNVKNNIYHIVKPCIESLLKDGTIRSTNVSIDDIMEDMSIIRLRRLIPNGIIVAFKENNFIKLSTKIRKVSYREYETVISGTLTLDTTHKTWKHKEYAKYWKANKLHANLLQDFIENFSINNKLAPEEVKEVKLDNAKSTLVSVNQKVEFNIDGNLLLPSNELSNIIMKNIEDQNLNISIMKDILEKYSNKLQTINEKGELIEKLNEDKIFFIEEEGYILINNKIFRVFNKLNEYTIKMHDNYQTILVKQLMQQEIAQSRFISKINNAKLWNELYSSHLLSKEILGSIFKSALNEYKKWSIPTDVLQKIVSKENIKIILHKYYELFIELFDTKQQEEKLLNLTKVESKQMINILIKIQNDTHNKISYNFLYALIQENYVESTSLFPKWDAERNFKDFLEAKPAIVSKLLSMETQDEVDNLIKKVQMYNIQPIQSSVYQVLQLKIHKALDTLPTTKWNILQIYGAKVRMMAEHVLLELGGMNSKHSKLSFADQVNKIPSLSKKYKSSLIDIYSSANKYHHVGHNDYKMIKNDEKKIKNNIVMLTNIMKYLKINNIMEYKEMIQWATQ